LPMKSELLDNKIRDLFDLFKLYKYQHSAQTRLNSGSFF